MSDDKQVNNTRRNLVIATCAAGGVAGAAAALPFAASWLPSERTKAGGAPVEVDISKLEPGEIMTVEWRSKPVWIVRRTKEMLAAMPSIESKLSDPGSDVPMQPEYAKNEFRSIKPEVLVLVGICSHLGCSPSGPFAPGANVALGDDMGFVCPCHGSTFDMAGRVWKGKPAPDNLEVPPHMYLSDTKLVIGEDKRGA